jgi:ribosomal-protein-alanine N-acetyltransferase
MSPGTRPVDVDVAVSTPRLELAPWSVDDAAAGLAIYGDSQVARWLSPAVEPIPDEETMRVRIEQWAEMDAEAEHPVGHWAVRRRLDGQLIGSVTLRRMPPVDEDLELAWQFDPTYWGHGYAAEAAHAIAKWGFERSAHELFAVTRPANERAIRLAERLGMQWVGETEKYYGMRLQVFRVRPPELLRPQIAPEQRKAG